MTIPYGIYDVTTDSGWERVGVNAWVDHDTAAFAVNTICRWLDGLDAMGRRRYPDAHSQMITADCGGVNGARLRLWKVELQ